MAAKFKSLKRNSKKSTMYSNQNFFRRGSHNNVFFHLKKMYVLAYGHFKSTLALASHADVLRGSSHVTVPLTSADLSEKKNVDQSQQTS